MTEAPSAIYRRGYEDALREGAVLDRDKARAVLAPWLENATDLGWQQVLDALAACVRPATRG